MLLYICPGDDGLPGAVREEQREVERDADGDFLEMILSQALTETSLLAIPDQYSSRSWLHSHRFSASPSENFRFAPWLATGDITPHRPPPLERPGGRINRKKTFRAMVIYGYQTASDPV